MENHKEKNKNSKNQKITLTLTLAGWHRRRHRWICLSGLRHRWICTFHRRRWRICSCGGWIHTAAAAGAHAYRHRAARRHRAPRPLPPARDRCRPTARAYCRICAGEGQGGRHCRRSQTHTRCHRRRRQAHQAWQLPPLVPIIGREEMGEEEAGGEGGGGWSEEYWGRGGVGQGRESGE